MVYIVKQKVNGKDYYYLRKSVREEGKVKSKSVAYLGKTWEEAEKKAEEIIKNMENKNQDAMEKQQVQEESRSKNDLEGKKNPRELEKQNISVEELANFSKSKGFVFRSGDLYGGFSGFWDFGPVGVELKNNLKKEWWKEHVYGREEVVGIDGSIITNPKVWEASGHVQNFVDVAVVCKKCGNKSKVDKHELETAKCEKCGGEFESRGEFNPMFTTTVGAVKEDSTTAYLRPETAQLIFSNFKQTQEVSRLKLPLGIAQIGKAFRNEVAPRDFLFRVREMEQMELEYFIDPEEKESCPYIREVENMELNVLSEDMQKNSDSDDNSSKEMTVREILDKGLIKLPWHAYWLAKGVKWFLDLGASPENFRIRQHLSEELSHYATDTWDIEYKFPFGWKELEGIADRGTYDLEQHEMFSKKDMKIFDDKKQKKILPMVVAEPSLGLERAFLVFLFDSLYKNQKGENVLKISPRLSPVKASVFPIVKRPEFQEMAEKIVGDLRKEWNVKYDKSGSIGKRYARNDEIGTPFCITVDDKSLEAEDVTIRDRDTAKQIRVKIKDLKNTLRDLINEDKKFEDFVKG